MRKQNALLLPVGGSKKVVCRGCDNCTVVYVASALFANERHKTLANGTVAKRFVGETTDEKMI